MKEHCSPRAFRAHGWGLFEICVVLAIVGVLAAVSVPRLSALLAPSPRRDAERAAAFISRAQLRAQARREPYLVAVAPHELTWTAEALPDDPIERIHLRSAIDVRGTRREIVIHPTGVVSPITLTVTAGGVLCTIAVSLRGRTAVRC